ncbi:MAG: 2-amino-4-hydroxy-6-hydroxymethyldihydropteridine diphosphokinase [Flavobacteriales bacterium]|nr:2-amino-4-hydroxy-6-hydroxymethyldihydropteridine diphosphokinase [Flavobacteriales bacterium]
MPDALLLLGGNVGEVRHTFAQATLLLEAAGVQVKSRSRIHQTTPWGGVEQPDFLNQALLVAPALGPRALLHACLGVESALGRHRSTEQQYGPRTIDIDILLFGSQVVNEPDLHIPHPLLQDRAFALAPAADVAPGWSHPVLERTMLELLNDLRSRPEP